MEESEVPMDTDVSSTTDDVQEVHEVASTHRDVEMVITVESVKEEDMSPVKSIQRTQSQSPEKNDTTKPVPKPEMTIKKIIIKSPLKDLQVRTIQKSPAKSEESQSKDGSPNKPAQPSTSQKPQMADSSSKVVLLKPSSEEEKTVQSTKVNSSVSQTSETSNKEPQKFSIKDSQQTDPIKAAVSKTPNLIIITKNKITKPPAKDQPVSVVAKEVPQKIILVRNSSKSNISKEPLTVQNMGKDSSKEITSNQTLDNKSPEKDASSKQSPIKESLTKQIIAKDTPDKEHPCTEIPTKKNPSDDTPATQSPVKEVPAKQNPAKSTAVKENPSEDTKAKQSPVKEVPDMQIPTKGFLAKHSPVKEIPAKQSPLKEFAIKESLSEDTKAKQLPVKQVPAMQTSSKEVSAKQSTPNEVPAKQIPSKDMPAKHTQEVPEKQTPNKEIPAKTVPTKDQLAKTNTAKEPPPKTPSKEPTSETPQKSAAKEPPPKTPSKEPTSETPQKSAAKEPPPKTPSKEPTSETPQKSAAKEPPPKTSSKGPTSETPKKSAEKESNTQESKDSSLKNKNLSLLEDKEASNDSQMETASDTSEKEHNKSISRELKSLIKSAKESKIISECTQLTSKTRKSRTPLDTSLNASIEAEKIQAVRRSSHNSQMSNSSEKSDKAAAKRSMRSQNPEFVSKVKNFLNSVSGKGQKVENEADDDNEEKAKENEKELTPSLPKKKKTEVVAEKPVTEKVTSNQNNQYRMDPYCWRCHWLVDPPANEKPLVKVHCTVCPRSFHFKCLTGTERNKVNAAKSWVCPECTCILQAESSETRSPAMKKISLGMLKDLLKHALDRMMEINGAEPFVNPVDRNEFPDYDNYVVHPMDLSLVRKQIDEGLYGSTEAFLADVLWILHNCIIFNTLQAKLTGGARALVRSCRAEMGEIEACPECYAAAHARRATWFTDVCTTPHILLWAKLKGFPYWPAKGMSVNNHGLVDVRFFGAHDRAWVPARDCFLFSEKDPNNFRTKRQDILDSMQEAEQHIRNISRKYGKFVYPPFRTTFEPSKLNEQLKLMIPSFEGEVRSPKNKTSVSPAAMKTKRRSISKSSKGSVQEGDASDREESAVKSRKMATGAEIATEKEDFSVDKEKEKPMEVDPPAKKQTAVLRKRRQSMFCVRAEPVEADATAKTENNLTRKRRRSQLEEAVITIIDNNSTREKRKRIENADKLEKKDSKEPIEKKESADKKDIPDAKEKDKSKVEMPANSPVDKKNSPKATPIRVISIAKVMKHGNVSPKVSLLKKQEEKTPKQKTKPDNKDEDNNKNEDNTEQDQQKDNKEEKNAQHKNSTKNKLLNNSNAGKAAKPADNISKEIAAENTKKEKPTDNTNNEEPTPSTSKEKTFPITSKEKAASTASKDKTVPNTSKEPPAPITSKEITAPTTSKEKTVPTTNKEKTASTTSKEKPAPTTSKEKPAPTTSKEKTAPTTSKEKGKDSPANKSSESDTDKPTSSSELKTKDRIQFDDDTSLAVLARVAKSHTSSSLPTISGVRSLSDKSTTSSAKSIEITVEATQDSSIFTPTSTDNVKNMREAVNKLQKLRGDKEPQPTPPQVGRVGVRAFARMTSPPEKETRQDVQVEVKTEPMDYEESEKQLQDKIDMMSSFSLRPVNPPSNLRDVRINKVVVTPLARKGVTPPQTTSTRARKTFPQPKKPDEGRSELTSKNSMVYIPIQPPVTQAPLRNTRPATGISTPPQNRNTMTTISSQPAISSIANQVNTITSPLQFSSPSSSGTPTNSSNPIQTMATIGPLGPMGPLPTVGPVGGVPTVGQVPTTVHTMPLITSVNGQWTFSLQPVLSVGGDSDPSPPMMNGIGERPGLVPIAPNPQSMLIPATPPANNTAQSTDTTTQPAELPRLQQRPSLVNPLDANAPVGCVPPPSTVGPLTSKLNQNAVKMTDFFRTLLEDSIEKLDEPLAQVTSLKLKLEQIQWRHQQELDEVKHNHQLVLAEMRSSFEKEKTRLIAETRRQSQIELDTAVKLAKSKQWCANCNQEAQFYCCWNTAYCDYPCQRAHWATHYAVCAQHRTQDNSGCDNNNPPENRLQQAPENLPKTVAAPNLAAAKQLQPSRMYSQESAPQKTSIIVSMVEDNSGNQTMKCVGTYKSPAGGTQMSPLIINKQIMSNEETAKKVVTSGGYLIVGASNATNSTSITPARRATAIQYIS